MPNYLCIAVTILHVLIYDASVSYSEPRGVDAFIQFNFSDHEKMEKDFSDALKKNTALIKSKGDNLYYQFTNNIYVQANKNPGSKLIVGGFSYFERCPKNSYCVAPFILGSIDKDLKVLLQADNFKGSCPSYFDICLKPGYFWDGSQYKDKANIKSLTIVDKQSTCNANSLCFEKIETPCPIDAAGCLNSTEHFATGITWAKKKEWWKDKCPPDAAGCIDDSEIVSGAEEVVVHHYECPIDAAIGCKSDGAGIEERVEGDKLTNIVCPPDAAGCIDQKFRFVSLDDGGGDWDWAPTTLQRNTLLAMEDVDKKKDRAEDTQEEVDKAEDNKSEADEDTDTAKSNSDEAADDVVEARNDRDDAKNTQKETEKDTEESETTVSELGETLDDTTEEYESNKSIDPDSEETANSKKDKDLSQDLYDNAKDVFNFNRAKLKEANENLETADKMVEKADERLLRADEELFQAKRDSDIADENYSNAINENNIAQDELLEARKKLRALRALDVIGKACESADMGDCGFGSAARARIH
jgi:hypothetical protein